MTDENGAATLLMFAVVGLLATLAVATAGLAGIFAARGQANTSADAAALAAAVATYPPAAGGSLPVSAARRAAQHNGAQLASCSCPIDGSLHPRTVTVVAAVTVTVPLFGDLEIKGAARAEFDPRRWLGR